ncbi:MAG TPA: DNA-binding protein WhiA [Candidatus Avoscillospira avicola]|uniref:Probable cell division protein WhiA n=1 Tax=Candidatus Avoscillospira avicola TaxID=2840706 RepID=A0A9D1APK8_9FIRM|nr:DNA-binding protein WhiA [Candidatus Avoscillospira avicola]
MSFCAQVKQELCKLPPSRSCCAVAESYGVLLFCNTFSPRSVRIVTESRDFAQRLPRLFQKAFGLTFDQMPESDQGKQIFTVDDARKIRHIYDVFGLEAATNVALQVNLGILEEDCCRAAFLRGAFMAGGSVTDPEKRYHLELATSHLRVSREVRTLMDEMGFAPKCIDRAGSHVLYFKQSDLIEDFLTTLGAPVCAMGIMEAKVEKDLRNGVNRRVNCETANLGKAVDAAQEQLAAIRRLEERGLFQDLPDKLRQTAQLRRENPEATLLELAQSMDPPVSKSAINHRMRKLIELSKQ